MRVLKIIPSIENTKMVLITILGTIAWLFVMTLITGLFFLMMALMWLTDNILEFYAYCSEKKFTSRPPSFLIQYYRLVRYGIRKLKRKLFGRKSNTHSINSNLL